MKSVRNKISNKLFPVRPPLYADKYLQHFTWNIKESKSIYLTFDDGPTPEITEKVLAVLDEKKIKATFFCLGRNVERHYDIYKKILQAGHKTGNHTYSHLNGWKTKFYEYINDVELANNCIDSKLFRPPYGKIKPRQLSHTKNNYRIVMWDVLSGDYNQKISPKQCFNNVVRFAKQGSIVVFHDSLKASKNLFYTLPKAIDYLLEQGFTFDVVPD